VSNLGKKICTALYTLLYAEDEDTVRELLSRTWGEDASPVVEEAKKILTELRERHGETQETLHTELMEMCREYVQEVISKILSSEDLTYLAQFFAKNQFYPISLSKVRTFTEMMGLNIDLDKLVKEGVLLQVDESGVVLPAFTEPFLPQVTCDVSLDDLLENIQQNYTLLSVLEAYVDGKVPVSELFEKLYGVEYQDALSRVAMHRVAKYCPEEGDLVLNPCIDIHELREKLHELKKARARSILRRLDITMGYGKYSRRLGALSHVVAFGPGVHGVILCAPWLVPTRGLERYMCNIARLIVTNVPFRREFAEYFHQMLEETSTFRKTAFVFLQEGVAYLVSPAKRDRVLDAMIDFLYRCGLEVLEF